MRLLSMRIVTQYPPHIVRTCTGLKAIGIDTSQYVWVRSRESHGIDRYDVSGGNTQHVLPQQYALGPN